MDELDVKDKVYLGVPSRLGGLEEGGAHGHANDHCNLQFSACDCRDHQLGADRATVMDGIRQRKSRVKQFQQTTRLNKTDAARCVRDTIIDDEL